MTDDELRKAFGYRLRAHVTHQSGENTAAPSLIFADADFEGGDGNTFVHEDDKNASEPAIIYVRADGYLAACRQVSVLSDEVLALRAEVEKLRPWARLGVAVMEGWPDTFGDMDGFELHDRAVIAGVLQEVPGGYDPEQHFDSAGVCPERGDPWFEIVRGPSAAALKEEN